MTDWYLLRGGEPHGPYPEEQIREWIRRRRLAPSEMLNKAGEPNWKRVDECPEFAADLASLASPTPYVPASSTPYRRPNPPKDRITAGILAILLGGLGIHHFYLGNTGRGILYIVLGCIGISPILGLIDGILYLVKSEEEFQRNYPNWFCSGS